YGGAPSAGGVALGVHSGGMFPARLPYGNAVALADANTSLETPSIVHDEEDGSLSPAEGKRTRSRPKLSRGQRFGSTPDLPGGYLRNSDNSDRTSSAPRRIAWASLLTRIAAGRRASDLSERSPIQDSGSPTQRQSNSSPSCAGPLVLRIALMA